MTALPVAYYLKELSGEVSRRGGRPLAAFGQDGGSDLEAQIADAHARGVLEGQAGAQAEFGAAAAIQAAAFEQKLAAERETWAAEEGARLGVAIVSGLEDIEQRISGLVSEVLKPFLGDQVRAKAALDLSQALKGMLSKGDYAKITVSGPADLMAAVEQQLSGQSGVSFVVADGSDLTVSADETILATRVGAWVNAIEGAAL